MNLEEIKKYGQSANDIPVDRVTLKIAEFDQLRSEVERLQEQYKLAMASCNHYYDQGKKQTAEECAKLLESKGDYWTAHEIRQTYGIYDTKPDNQSVQK